MTLKETWIDQTASQIKAKQIAQDALDATNRSRKTFFISTLLSSIEDQCSTEFDELKISTNHTEDHKQILFTISDFSGERNFSIQVHDKSSGITKEHLYGFKLNFKPLRNKEDEWDLLRQIKNRTYFCTNSEQSLVSAIQSLFEKNYYDYFVGYEGSGSCLNEKFETIKNNFFEPAKKPLFGKVSPLTPRTLKTSFV